MFCFCKAHLQWEQGDSVSFPAVDGTYNVLYLGQFHLMKNEKPCAFF